MSLTSPRTIRIYVHDWMGLTNSHLSNIRKRDLNLPDESRQRAILPHADVRKRDLDLPDESWQRTILMCMSPRTIRIHVHDCMGLTNSRLSYIRKRDLNLSDESRQRAILPHANVRKRDLDLPVESRQRTILMFQIGGKFSTCLCIFSDILLTQQQRFAPLFELNQIVIYVTHLHTHICYVCNMLYIYNFVSSYVCYLEEGKKKKNMIWKKGKYMNMLFT